MKRLVWLFLAVFCTALAQVRPVESPQPKAEQDCCCEDSCGMANCDMLPTATHQPTVLDRTSSEAGREARRTAAKLSSAILKFYLPVLESVVVATTLRAPVDAAPTASPPLFRVHCSYLI